MSRLLDGRVALVTGAATGLGAAIAWRLADAGAIGLAFDIAERCQDLPQGWVAHKGDVSENVDLLDATDKIRQEFGRLDVVVANAGLVPPWRDTENINFDEWDQVFAVNVKGVAATIRHAVPLMKERGGSILAMGSLNSHCAHASQCLYTASKHAVLGIVRATALDLGHYGIRVNALGPGPVATDETLEQFASDTALGRMVTKEDVARAALFLVSDQSGGITGQILPVDAGLP